MKNCATPLQLLSLASTSNALQAASSSRRDLFQTMVGSAASAAVAAVVLTTPDAANAIASCPAKTTNCIRTTWSAPDGTKDVAGAMSEILNSYPQEGQNKADLGGWALVEGDLSKGKARAEFQSGLGNFAKFLNGGKPFVDDLDIEISGNTVEIRSASRVGESDFDVNKKRLQFLANVANGKGFTTPEIKY